MKTYLMLMSTVFFGLVGCANIEEKIAGQGSVPASISEKQNILGSRIARPTTDQMVKAVGNKDYEKGDLHTGIANRLSSPGN